MSSHDDEHDPLLDEVLGALEHALGDLDVHGLKAAVKKGLQEAARAIEDGEDAVEVEVEVGGEADDNVVPLAPHREGASPEEDGEPMAVQVLTGGLGQGRLRVSDGWQTVWTGPEAVAYRLSLGRGQLEVVVDDQMVAQLIAGQTTDVAGRSVRVRGTGRGSYRRL